MAGFVGTREVTDEQTHLKWQVPQGVDPVGMRESKTLHAGINVDGGSLPDAGPGFTLRGRIEHGHQVCVHQVVSGFRIDAF